jgi:hypothetical protein
VNDVLPDTPPGQQAQSVRDRLEMHRTDPVCAACHALFDPIGLTFENFDGIGSYRTTDAGKTIDPTGDLEGKTYKSLHEVAAFLRADSRPGHCLSKHLFSFATGHEVEPGEEGVVEALGDLLAANGHKLQGLLRSVASSPGFRYFSADN